MVEPEAPEQIEWPPKPFELNLFRTFTRQERAGLLEHGCLQVGDALNQVPSRVLEYEPLDRPALITRLGLFHPQESFHPLASGMYHRVTEIFKGRYHEYWHHNPLTGLREYRDDLLLKRLETALPKPIESYIGNLLAGLTLLEPHRLETQTSAGAVRSLLVVTAVSRADLPGGYGANGVIFSEREVNFVHINWNETFDGHAHAVVAPSIRYANDEALMRLGFHFVREFQDDARWDAISAWVLTPPKGLKRIFQDSYDPA